MPDFLQNTENKQIKSSTSISIEGNVYYRWGSNKVNTQNNHKATI